MQLDPDLTLQKALDATWQVETVRQQQVELNHAQPSVNKVGVAHQEKSQGSRKPFSGSSSKNTRSSSPLVKKHVNKFCHWCGRDSHPRSACPTRNEKCKSRLKKGHYATVCLSKRVDAVQAQDDGTESGFLGMVSSSSTKNWEATVKVQGRPLKFKIDTCADDTVIPPETFRQLERRPVLSKPRRPLHGPDGRPLAIQRVARLQLSYQGRQTTQDIYVLDEVRCPLFRKPAIEELQLITCINNVQRAIKLKQEFPSLFSGLGAFQGEHQFVFKTEPSHLR